MAKEDSKPKVTKPEYRLVVTEPFNGLARGVIIDDATTIEAILSSDNSGHVHKISALD